MGETEQIAFKGKLQKMQLISNNLCYGPCPQPEDEIEQRLTITANGRVWLSRYQFGELGHENKIIEKTSFSISEKTANEIMEAVGRCFSDNPMANYATDVGTWELKLTNTEGIAFNLSGSLIPDDIIESCGLSDLIRARLGQKDLFVFDGNPDD